MPELQELENVVQSTTDYDRFTILGANRRLNRPHVNKLKIALEENGNFTKSVPVLVNQRMEVIDGQHRLEACRELRLPVYYTVVSGLSIKDARNMNILQRNWRVSDYLESYVNEGLPAYIKLNQLVEDYGDVFGLSILILYANGKQYSGYGRDYRTGDLPDFDLEKARDRLDDLSQLRIIFPGFATKVMAVALLNIMNSPNYDQDRMVRCVSRKADTMKVYQLLTENMRQLEEVYNNRARVSRARLF